MNARKPLKKRCPEGNHLQWESGDIYQKNL